MANAQVFYVNNVVSIIGSDTIVCVDGEGNTITLALEKHIKDTFAEVAMGKSIKMSQLLEQNEGN